jgi:hypothetical protein
MELFENDGECITLRGRRRCRHGAGKPKILRCASFPTFICTRVQRQLEKRANNGRGRASSSFSPLSLRRAPSLSAHRRVPRQLCHVCSGAIAVKKGNKTGLLCGKFSHSKKERADHYGKNILLAMQNLWMWRFAHEGQKGTRTSQQHKLLLTKKRYNTHKVQYFA